jgi:hypothetical protein
MVVRGGDFCAGAAAIGWNEAVSWSASRHGAGPLPGASAARGASTQPK